MSGLIFFRSKDLEKIREEYIEKIGMELWLDQGGCLLLRHGNFLLGFCQNDKSETKGVITFFYDQEAEIDKMYDVYKDKADGRPRFNDRYNIYHFYTRDFEGRILEFQKFNNESLPSYKSLTEGLIYRRSIRKFKDKEISQSVLDAVFEECRYSPTSRNHQSYYYVVIKDKSILSKLANIRPGASAPLGKGNLAVAVCVDSDKTIRITQDADIAAYHLLLAAYNQVLGSCWVTEMDRVEVKKLLKVPQKDFITMITPLGYPDEVKEAGERRNIDEFVRYI